MKRWLATARLDLLPLDPDAAAALPEDRDRAAEIIDARLPDSWPQPDLHDILPRQVELAPSDRAYGIWLIVERETSTVVGDAGFHGPAGAEGEIEIGYSVIPERRRRGYATEAAQALVDWVLAEPAVSAVVAGCGADNRASIRILEHLGFQPAGRRDTQLRWRRPR